MGIALVTAVGWGPNWPVSKYLLTELPLLSTLKQGIIDTFALQSLRWCTKISASVSDQTLFCMCEQFRRRANSGSY